MKSRMRSTKKRQEVDVKPGPLSKADRAKLERRLSEMMDPTRYIIVSAFFPKHNMFYQVAEGTYILNQITSDTLFKNRADALAVARAVDGRRKRTPDRFALQVIAVRKTKKGVRILEVVTSPWNSKKTWRPVLRRS